MDFYAIGLPGGGETFFLFTVLPVILWVVALVDCLRSNFESNTKLIWVIVIIFLPILGALLYFLIGRGQKIKA